MGNTVFPLSSPPFEKCCSLLVMNGFSGPYFPFKVLQTLGLKNSCAFWVLQYKTEIVFCLHRLSVPVLPLFCSVNVLLSNLISTDVCCIFSPVPFAMNVSMKNFRKANSARWPQIASQSNSTETYMWGSLCHEAFESCIFRSSRTRGQGGVWIQLCAVLCWGPDGKGCRRGCCRRTRCPQLCFIEHSHSSTHQCATGQWLATG